MTAKTPNVETRSAGPPPTGWFWIENGIVDRIGEVGRLAAVVYMTLVRHADVEHRVAEVFVAKIAATVGVTDRAVRDAIRRLRDAGLIEVDEQHDQSGRNRANRYRILRHTPPSGGGSPVQGTLKLSSGMGELEFLL